MKRQASKSGHQPATGRPAAVIIQLSDAECAALEAIARKWFSGYQPNWTAQIVLLLALANWNLLREPFLRHCGYILAEGLPPTAGVTIFREQIERRKAQFRKVK